MSGHSLSLLESIFLYIFILYQKYIMIISVFILLNHNTAI